MGYFTSSRNGWYELNDFNLSGTGGADVGSVDYDINTIGTWITVGRFDNDEIDLKSVIYRSAIQEDGVTSLFTLGDPTNTAKLSMRILPPGSNIGLGVFTDLSLTGTAAIGVTEASFIPARNIPRNSLLQAKITVDKTRDFTGTNNRMYLQFNYEYRGVDPQLTSLLEY
jgi:hypothetical protein